MTCQNFFDLFFSFCVAFFVRSEHWSNRKGGEVLSNLFVVYNQRLAGYLMQSGFPLVKMIENDKTGKNNFLFANVPLLHDRIDKWQIEKNKSTNERKEDN